MDVDAMCLRIAEIERESLMLEKTMEELQSRADAIVGGEEDETPGDLAPSEAREPVLDSGESGEAQRLEKT